MKSSVQFSINNLYPTGERKREKRQVDRTDDHHDDERI